MKKIIKLNLNDIENIVKNTINEMESEEPTDLDDALGDEYYVGDETDLKPPPLLIGKNADTGELTIVDTRTNTVLYKKMI
jgi:hypothetical protein